MLIYFLLFVENYINSDKYSIFLFFSFFLLCSWK